jgi:hypothetical protein
MLGTLYQLEAILDFTTDYCWAEGEWCASRDGGKTSSCYRGQLTSRRMDTFVDIFFGLFCYSSTYNGT